MDIGGWLRGFGLGQYEAAFRENEIDGEVLPTLTAEDLKELGVTILGHRRKMLTAIAELSASSAAPAPIATPPAAPEPSPALAERRQLTVMFCDLVGSTALSARLDPEDLRGVIGAYHRCCAEAIERNGGFVAKYMGDGVLAYFGYPRAGEHDAERAVRAGLALVEAAPRLNTAAGAPLQVRVGIATGLVVVGDLLGAGAAQEQAVVGETPNLAARLQAIAEPGAVVIAASTHRLTGGLFEYHDLGVVALKGFADDVRAWQALREGVAEGRFEALHATTTPLVGRDEEIELLLRRWAEAKSGEGRVVLVSGEPGIGKSRLVQTLLERLAAEPHSRLRYFCSPHHQNSALYPAIAQLERAAGFRREDSPEQKLAKVETVLALGTNDLGQAVPLLADLLGVPTVGRYPPLALTPQKQKEKTLQAMLTQVEGLAARQPVLMAFEDMHWSDPTTREILGPADRSRGHIASPVGPDVPAGIRSALDRPPPRERSRAQPPAAERARRDDRPSDRRQDAAEGDFRSDRRAHRRGAAVHRGADQDHHRERHRRRGRRRLGGERTRRAAVDPDVAARLAVGAARSSGADARGRADRLRARAAVLA